MRTGEREHNAPRLAVAGDGDESAKDVDSKVGLNGSIEVGAELSEGKDGGVANARVVILDGLGSEAVANGKEGQRRPTLATEGSIGSLDKVVQLVDDGVGASLPDGGDGAECGVAVLPGRRLVEGSESLKEGREHLLACLMM